MSNVKCNVVDAECEAQPSPFQSGSSPVHRQAAGAPGPPGGPLSYSLSYRHGAQEQGYTQALTSLSISRSVFMSTSGPAYFCIRTKTATSDR